MSMTNAERQARYRRKRPLAGRNGERRISTWVSTGTALALERLACREGLSMRAVLERLITEADDQILSAMSPDSPEFTAYLYQKDAAPKDEDPEHGAAVSR